MKDLSAISTRIKEYKEIIAALIFFSGGIFWVVGYFATKDEFRKYQAVTTSEREVLHCLLETNVTWLEGEIMYLALTDELIEIKSRAEEQTRVSGPIPPSIAQNLFALEHEGEVLREQIARLVENRDMARQLLMQGKCLDSTNGRE